MSRHVLSSADHDRSIAVAVGDEVVIDLPERATAGYQWFVVAAPPGVDVSIDRSAVNTSVGGEALAHVVARVRAAGGGVLELEHRRPWDSFSTERRFRITLGVT